MRASEFEVLLDAYITRTLYANFSFSNSFTADAIFEGLQQGLRATEQGGSASLVEDFVSGPIDPIAALGDAVAQVKAQFDCAAFKVIHHF